MANEKKLTRPPKHCQRDESGRVIWSPCDEETRMGRDRREADGGHHRGGNGGKNGGAGSWRLQRQ
ncbi:Protein kinase domain-containing protein [Psidium guajava]|nr:Protein kinase domain-containing protein [Psidium guajava]